MCVQAAPDAKLADLKALLGRMLFSGNAMDKKVRLPHLCVCVCVRARVLRQAWWWLGEYPRTLVNVMLCVA
jgi:hypothetical protein